MTDTRVLLAVRNVLASPDGRLVLRGILFDICKVEDATFEDEDSALTAARRDGRRSAGRDLRRLIEKVDPKGFVGLLTEDIDANHDASA